MIENGKNVFEKQENTDLKLLSELEEKLLVAELSHVNEVFKKKLFLRRRGR